MFPWFQAKAPPASSMESGNAASLEAAMQQSSVLQLEAALLAMPENEKAEYLQALRVAPGLVETESDTTAFLRFCDWDATAAARRITVYWRKRKELFGETRAFLPLLNDMSGNGALGREELELFRGEGFDVIHTDSHGRAVVCVDRKTASPHLHVDVKVRVAFMVIQQMSMNPESQASGAVFVIRGLQTSETNTGFRQIASELLREAFPVRMHAIHVVYVRQEGNGFLQAAIPFLLQTFSSFLSNKLNVHDCASTEELVGRMTAHGISRESLPRSMGGYVKGAASNVAASNVAGLPFPAFGETLIPERPISQLLEALRAIPQHEKAECLQALRVAPQLVETESNPEAFLRFCDWNATAAARRIAVYWRKRRNLFGETRAFLPLHDLSGNGALGSEELELLRNGAYCMLPSRVHGRNVFFTERLRIPPKFTLRKDIKLRACFATFQQLALNNVSQTSEIELLIQIGGTLPNGDGNIIWEATELLEEAFPVRASSAHVVFIRGDEKKGIFQYLVPFILQTVGHFLTTKIIVHSVNSVEEAAEKLSVHGFLRETLPDSLGGLVCEPGASFFSSHALSKEGPVKCHVAIGDYQHGQLPELASPAETSQTPVFKIGSRSRGCEDSGEDPNLSTATLGSEAAPGPSPQEQLWDAGTENGGLGDMQNELISQMLEIDATEFNVPPFRSGPLRSPKQHQEVVNTAHATKPNTDSTCNEDAMLDTDAAVFNKMAGMFALAPGSPFDPRPIRRSPKPHEPAVSTVVDTSFSRQSAIAVGAHELSLASLDESMRLLPDAETAAYREAVRTAPKVLQTESDPLAFLRFVEFNAWDAAVRLATYWKRRARYFGHRAFLPLTQTMGGALWEEDLRTLTACSFFFLPTHSRGRPVLCWDLTKRPEGVSKDSCIRVAMYFFSILWCEYPASRKEGCVLFLLVPTQLAGLSKVDQTTREVADLVVDAFPIKSFETHVILSQSPITNPPPTSFSTSILPLLQHAVGRLLSHGQAHFHVCNTHDELRHELVSFGFSGGGLEAVVEGGVSVQDFAWWMNNRQLLERQRISDLDHQNKPTEQQQAKLPAATIPEDTNSAAVVQIKGSPERVGTSTPSMHGIALAMESVSASEKEAYLEAMKRVPDLVKNESAPSLFLKVEKFDTIAAARRLAAYWRIRREVFGERAFLPMNQTSEGGLDRRDLTALQTGYLVQLPNDSAGCSVISCDGSLLKKASRSTRLHLFFYMLFVVSQNDSSQTDGYSLVYTLRDPSFDRAFQECLHTAMEAHPVRLKCFHLLGCCSSGTSERDIYEGPIEEMTKTLERPIQEKVAVHVCTSWSDFADKLGSRGMSKDGLPKALGGDWWLDDFLQWQDLRIRFEWDLPIGLPALEVAESYSIPAFSDSPMMNLTDREKAVRQRRLNTIYSRRKRDRSRIEVHVLQEQCSTLREERKQLLREGQELEELQQRAVAVVASSSAIPPRSTLDDEPI